MLGRTLGHYQIRESLGSGGMGTVYRARDTRLKRDVAVKVLADRLVRDEQGLARLAREAQMLAAVNHPNIATIHSLEEVGEVRFLVLELVDGASLAELIRGRMTVREVLEICGQIAEALEAAHARGIVHRDLKPANVVVTPERKVKVLDFGIAKARAVRRPLLESLSSGGNEATQLTDSGMILGTGPYMSPEQIRGAEPAPAADIWAFGCVLYEALTGRPPFDRETLADTLSAVLEHEPDWAALPADTPEPVLALLSRCLQKDPRARLRDIGDAWLEIRTTLGDPTTGATWITERVARQQRARRRLVWGLTAVGVVMATAIALAPDRRAPTGSSSTVHRQVTFTGDATDAAISPDGRSVAFVTGRAGAEQRLMLTDVAGGRALELFRAPQVMLPQWSRDGSELTFAADDERSATLRAYRLPRLGGAARQLGPGLWTTWAPAGDRIASAIVRPRGFTVYSGDGSERFVALDGYDFTRGLEWSPTEDRIAVLASTRDGRFELFVVDPGGGDRRSLLSLDEPLSAARWAPDGRALYVLRHRNSIGDLLRIDLDDDGARAGPPRVALAGLRITEVLDATFSLSADGKTLVYSTRHKYANLWKASLSGRGDAPPEPLTSGTSLIERPAISPDGRWVAYSSTSSTGANLYKIPLDGGEPVQLTSGDGYDTSPAWSPDGRLIAFSTRRPEGVSVWTIKPDGTAPRRLENARVSPGTMRLFWSPGTSLMLQQPGNQDFTVYDPADGSALPLVPEEAYARRADEPRGWTFAPRVAPDRSAVAISWNRPPSHALWLITRDPYTERRLTGRADLPIGWSADGQWIYVITSGGPVNGDIGRVPRTGGQAETLVTLPGGVRFASVDPTGTTVVAAVQAQQADVFVVEGFDGGRR